MVIGFFALYGVIDSSYTALWIQFTTATVTLVFALLYATTGRRVVLYSTILAGGGLLMGYGILSGDQWAYISASVAQALGVTTAAAKAVPPVDIHTV